MKAGSKYYPLFEYLHSRLEERIELTFQEIEFILGDDLPESAAQSKAFWSNRTSGALQARAWMDAGHHVHQVDLSGKRVVFQRPTFHYRVQREGEEYRWNGEMVRALRAHLDLSQSELADILGVRQQTVSEWETEAYAPTRGRSKHLTMVAENAGFYLGDKTEEAQ
ncbi:MAG: helix-turn-helix domain-containing protein [Anaerolineales bacterium]|nr:helix-turn-helix domain-containing protein [Anaerolineales bacterium]